MLNSTAPSDVDRGLGSPERPRFGERLHSVASALWNDRKNRTLLFIAGIFLLAFFVPLSAPRVQHALSEAFAMLGDYARQHVLLCLVPAFFIAGGITVFLNQQSVIRYLGPTAPRLVAYSVASVSGTILAVCSCTVLPLFKGIYKKGAGLGPAVSFLYSGPAINVLAIVLTANVLGWRLGLSRAVGAIAFAFVIGWLMHLIFRKEDDSRTTNPAMFRAADSDHGLGRTIAFMGSMIGILVFVNWAPSGGSVAAWDAIYRLKYPITALFAAFLVLTLVRWFKRQELREWLRATRDFALQILPLLFGGVLVAGFLLGRPGHMALIPQRWVAAAVGGNSVFANLFAAASGALMYFATLTEIPILQGLLGAGMGQGPALALLLAGPSMSLPSLLVIGGELGARKTLVYATLVIGMSTLVGMLYGAIV